MTLEEISKPYEKDNSLYNEELELENDLINHSYKIRCNFTSVSQNSVDFYTILFNKKYGIPYKSLSILYKKSITKNFNKYKFKAYYNYGLQSKLTGTRYDDIFEWNHLKQKNLSLRFIHKGIELNVGNIGTVIITRK